MNLKTKTPGTPEQIEKKNWLSIISKQKDALFPRIQYKNTIDRKQYSITQNNNYLSLYHNVTKVLLIISFSEYLLPALYSRKGDHNKFLSTVQVRFWHRINTKISSVSCACQSCWCCKILSFRHTETSVFPLLQPSVLVFHFLSLHISSLQKNERMDVRVTRSGQRVLCSGAQTQD